MNMKKIKLTNQPAPIGVFDSGFGGLSILREIRKVLPEYDYIFLGDNARAPYGSRSFTLVYEYTLQAVQHLFEQGCSLVILACNTASAKALRTIQHIAPARLEEAYLRPLRGKVFGIQETGGRVRCHSFSTR